MTGPGPGPGPGPGSLADRLGAFAGRRVLVTGHTGFVGAWLVELLAAAGAEVTGYALEPLPGSLAATAGPPPGVRSIVGDVRDPGALAGALHQSGASVVLHLAAQALVLPSYDDPLGTFETNVTGTVRLLEAVRSAPQVAACLVVTSDKCYAVGPAAHTEGDPLGGEDPYSASKAATELVAHAWRASFAPAGGALATARAGNVVGGGDAAPERIVPDLARALRAGSPLVLRRPDAVRPWQHVLDAVAGYLRLTVALLEGDPVAEAWNFGPEPGAAASVGEFVDLLAAACRRAGRAAPDIVAGPPGPPERHLLLLDSTKARHRLGWRPVLDLEATAEWTIEWYLAARDGAAGTRALTRSQIERYLALEHDGAGTTGLPA